MQQELSWVFISWSYRHLTINQFIHKALFRGSIYFQLFSAIKWKMQHTRGTLILYEWAFTIQMSLLKHAFKSDRY